MTAVGKTYNTTVAYRSEDLSTAAPCFANEGHGSNFQAVNYTMLQDPPPNSYFAFCDTGDVAISNIGASPMFSYPSDVTNLVPSWSTCTLPHVLGVMDPPHTLNRETVMVPAVSSSTAAAPAAHITPANAPATSTTKTGVLQSGIPDAQQSSNEDPAGNEPSQSSSDDPDLPSYDPSGDGPPHGENDDDPTSKPDLSSNPPPSSDNPPDNDPAKISLGSIIAPSSPPLNIQPQETLFINSATGDLNDSIMQSQGLGALIANAFGYAPSSTPQPINDPSAPSSNFEAIQTIINGIPSPVMVGDVPVSVAENGAMLVAGQTIGPGDQATVFGAVVSVGSNKIAIDGLDYTFSQPVAAAPTALVVGGHTAQGAPNGGLVIASRTVTPGAWATIDGTALSVGSSNVILDGTTYTLATMALSINVAQPWLSEASDSALPYVVAEQAPTPGDPAAPISSVSLSLAAAEASAIQADGPKPVTIGTQVFTPNPSAFVIGDTTISAGSPGVTIAGTVISLQPLGGDLVIGSRTFGLGSLSAETGSPISRAGGRAVTTRLSGGGTSSRARETRPTSIHSRGHSIGETRRVVVSLVVTLLVTTILILI